MSATDHINAVLEASESYEDWCEDYDAEETSSDGRVELENVKEAYGALLAAILGVTAVDCDYDSTSTYFDLHFADRAGDDETLQVRISNHSMRHAGPFASLTTTSTRRDIIATIEAIEAEIK